MDTAKRHLDAFVWFTGLVGAISTVYGVVEGDFWYLTAAAGYIGIASLLPLGILAGVGVLEDKGPDAPHYEIPAVVGSVIFGAVMHFLFPFREFELENLGGPNALSIVGIVVIVIAFVVGVSLYRDWERAKVPATKTCPDCANEILAAANVCQHCGYRFAPAGQAGAKR